MTIISIVGIEKKLVKVPCTACGGTGRTPFVDKTPVPEVREKTAMKKIDGLNGWRNSNKWSKAHYFIDGICLCRNVRSEDRISRSISVDDINSVKPCVTCMKRLDR
jgi:hypothetical protein